MISNAGLLPGTHAISAHYLGDTYTQASQSGALNVGVTGTTTFVISATPPPSNGTPTVNLTINYHWATSQHRAAPLLRAASRSSVSLCPRGFRAKFFFSFFFPACQLTIHPCAYKYLP